jgi:c-di-GMP-binding flagellar brake protein YcgR
MSQNLRLSEARQTPRLKLPPMYTLVRVKPQGDERYRWTGFVYDISMTGMRFELDAAVAPGTPLEIRAMLPGPQHTTFRAAGPVVRVHDDDDSRGPTRMGMTFTEMDDADRRTLQQYLQVNTEARQRPAA